jgi:hypothetical protein
MTTNPDISRDFSHLVLGLPDLPPPALGALSRPGALDAAEVQRRLDAFHAKHPGVSRDPARDAIALLWHDHLDIAHGKVQELESRLGMHLHGIMHRREGDYGNAKYWFRRAGHLAALDALVPHATNAGAAFLAPRGRWDDDAFVDAAATGDAKFIALQAQELQILASTIG